MALRLFVSFHGSSECGPPQPKQPGYPALSRSSVIDLMHSHASSTPIDNHSTSIGGSVIPQTAMVLVGSGLHTRISSKSPGMKPGKEVLDGWTSPNRTMRISTCSLNHCGPMMVSSSVRKIILLSSRAAGQRGSVIRMICCSRRQVLKDVV